MTPENRPDPDRTTPASAATLRVGAAAVATVIALLLFTIWTIVSRSGSPEVNAAPGDAVSLHGQPGEPVILVTGSTSGLGREVALRLAATGAHLIVHGRDEARGREVVDEIERAGVGSARFYRADLASLDESRTFAEAILTDYERLDVLINNAGIGSTSSERELSHDGYELRFHVNYLSGFLLTRLLLDRIVESAPARIVNVASGAQTPIDFDDVMLERDYSGSRAYGQSKLAQILFTVDLAEELEGTGVTVTALHPATFMDTPMVVSTGRTPMSSVHEGADAVMNLVVGEGIESGQYFNGLNPQRANAQAYDAQARARLRALSMEWAGLD